jgi:hypothetical protein
MYAPPTRPFALGAAVRLLGQHERGRAVVQWLSERTAQLLVQFDDGTAELVEPWHLLPDLPEVTGKQPVVAPVSDAEWRADDSYGFCEVCDNEFDSGDMMRQRCEPCWRYELQEALEGRR